MDDRHKEYLEYYQSRMKKYQNNPLYSNSYQSEKELYEAIRDSESLEDFGRKLEEENLAVKNAIALVKDQETARKKMYQDMNEDVRLRAPVRILEIVDSVESDMDLVTRVSEIETGVSKEISVDLFTDNFYYDFLILEEIEVHQTAEVPDEWKKQINQEYSEEIIASGRKEWQEIVLPQARGWDPDWNFDFNLVGEKRHRRKIPVPDEVVKKRLEQFKTYRGL
ncbi:MAG: hypothetical protein Q8N08_02035 [Methanobacteriaceae archaeon]|nr:hypothetical protein [Methanobacteriaceae archaeon]